MQSFWKREEDEAVKLERLTSAMIQCRASAVLCGVEGNKVGADTNRRHAALLAAQIDRLEVA